LLYFSHNTNTNNNSFFELAPRAKAAFGLRFNFNPTVENLSKNTVAVQHIIRLLHLLNLVLSMEGPPEVLYNVLEDLGRRHLKYKATAQMIPLMGEAVLLSLKKWLGDEVWDESVQAAWESVFDLMENRMAKGMAK
jgi:hemoglobin-like flavoprotein